MALQLNEAKELTAKAAEATRLLTALANESRLAILCELVEGEHSVGTLVEAVGLTNRLFRSISPSSAPPRSSLRGGMRRQFITGLQATPLAAS